MSKATLSGKFRRPQVRHVHLAWAAAALAAAWYVGACGSGSDAPPAVPAPLAVETISGRVFGGYTNALVCMDIDRSGICDASEPQVRTKSGGNYELSAPKDLAAPLLAEVAAGVATPDAAFGLPTVASYRMGTASRAHGTDITPFSTVALLIGQPASAITDDLVRNQLGLPAGTDVGWDAAMQASSLGHRAALAVIAGLATYASSSGGLSAAPLTRSSLATIAANFPPALADLPKIDIATKGGAPIVSREEYVDATYVLTDPLGATSTVTLKGKIRGRGHSTWGLPKNPYKVQFSNDAAYAAITDVMGMKKQRNWALLADYFDRSLIRNKLALSLGSSAAFRDGLRWTPSGQHVEVTLNGDYVGVYLLTEDIRLDPARLDLRKMNSSVAAADVDGGYIVEVDARLDCYKGADLDLQLTTPRGVPICIDTPDEDAATPAQIAFIKDFLMNAETAIYSAGGLGAVDQISFADWYLLQELFRNVDSMFYTSVFMWKDGSAAADPRHRALNLGPLWDFDRSAGNVDYNNGWQVEGCWVAKAQRPNWLAEMFKDPQFLALTLARWHQKRDLIAQYLDASIPAFSGRLASAQVRNFERWPILGTHLTNYYTFATYAEEVNFVRDYLKARMVWLDRAYASPEAFEQLCR